jgi:histone acetyltransferase MYST1
MPQTHIVKVANESPLFTVQKDGTNRESRCSVFCVCDLTNHFWKIVPVHIVKRRDENVFVHYVGLDRRMDEWIPEANCRQIKKRGRPPTKKRAVTESPESQVTSSASRRRSVAPMLNGKANVKEVEMTEEEFDLLQHKLPDKNFEKVYFGNWEVKVW